jgi:WD40 repeat protein/serine/threonine protein kinase
VGTGKKTVEAIFDAAIQFKSLKKRDAYVLRACGDDQKLLARVRALLEHHDASSFLDAPIFDPEVTLDTSPLTEGPGTTIGNYKLLEQIGEGGMAVVYMAEQEKPLRRRVALKIIKLGMDTKSVITRFEVERQALAVMDHPNISRVFDAGTTETGRPYFVMELVRGVSISRYCDKNKLNTKERLGLFVQVCNAVQHAHQKGIIHRDIKPSNILVTLHDGKPVPKVIDFGIAKATSQRLTEKTLFTRYAQMIGTPAYMSPEQAEMSDLDIDTRTDIYSLGVLLYELLTSTTPFSEEQLCEAGYLEMQRIIREEEPLKPSTKLSTLGDTLTDVAEHRKASPDLLQKLVRGDLDWIVMKSLDKDRTRRYDTANALAADIQRHLSHELVEANPPNTIYRIRKFVQKHRGTVAAVFTIIAILIAGFMVSTTLYLFAVEALGKEATARQAAEKAENIAQEKAEAHRRALYYNRIALADVQWHAANISSVHRLLELCPKDLRGWEWYHLLRISDQALMTLRGHDGNVNSVAFSPDGSRIVSCGDDQTIKVWETKSGAEVMTLHGHKSRITSVAFSPDGRRIVSGSMGHTLKIWDAQSGSELMTLLGHKVPVNSVAFSPDGKRIVSGTDNTLKVWDAESGSEVMTLRGREAFILSVAFSPDGRRIVVGGYDRMLKIWDANGGAEAMTLRGHEKFISSVAFSPDGMRIVSASKDKTLKIWDVNSGAEVMTLRGHNVDVTSTAFSPDGRWIVSGSSDKTLKVWDASSGEEIMTLRGYEREVLCVAFSPDSRWIVSGSRDNTLKIWDVESSGGLASLRGHGAQIRSVDFSPDGKRIVSGGGRFVKVWDVEAGSVVMNLKGHPNSVFSVAFSPDGRLIVSGSRDNTLKVWDAEIGREVMTLRGHKVPVNSVAFSRDGSRIVSGSGDKTLKVWDAETGSEVMALKGHPNSVCSVAFSPDGRKIVSGSGDNDLKVWDASSGAEVMTLRGHNEAVMSVAFSPDGRRIVSGSNDKTLKVWDANSGIEVMTLRGHEGNVNSVEFSPDGRRIISCCSNKALKVWDASSGAEAMTLRGHEGRINSVAYSPDGRRIASGSSDSTLKVWDSDSPEKEEELTLYLVRKYIASGQLEEAARLVEELLTLEGRETEMTGEAQLAITLLGVAYRNRAKTKVRERKFAEATIDYEAAMRFNMNHALYFNDLAWLQATCLEGKFRNSEKAIENATKACEITNWKKANYVGTLAAAYAEASDSDSAVKWQKKAIDLLSEDERTKIQSNYEERLKLYQSGQPYHKGHLWSFSTGKLIAWWKFDETEGYKVADSSGNGNDGTLKGNPIWQPSGGRIGGALLLDGNRDYVVIGNESNFDITGSITVAAWMKVNIFDKPWQTIVAKGSTWRLSRYSFKNSIVFSCTGFAPRLNLRSYGNIVGQDDVNDGGWHHICGTYDGVNIRLYVDGVEDSTSPDTYRDNIDTNNYNVWIGNNSQYPEREWNGLIDDLRIYSYALSEAQVKEIYTERGPGSNERPE